MIASLIILPADHSPSITVSRILTKAMTIILPMALQQRSISSTDPLSQHEANFDYCQAGLAIRCPSWPAEVQAPLLRDGGTVRAAHFTTLNLNLCLSLSWREISLNIPSHSSAESFPAYIGRRPGRGSMPLITTSSTTRLAMHDFIEGRQLISETTLTRSNTLLSFCQN